jgi:hypothetical protein
MTTTDDIEAVEVTIDGHTARITACKGIYVATFRDGPHEVKQVDGASPRKAWIALRDLIGAFKETAA